MTSAYEILAQLKRTASGPMTEARGAEPAFYWNEEVASAERKCHFPTRLGLPGPGRRDTGRGGLSDL